MITHLQQLARAIRIEALRQLGRDDEISALPPLRDLDLHPLTEVEEAELRGLRQGILLALEVASTQRRS